MKSQDDTIAAIITPIGEGGISVIRISGNSAIEIAERGFRGKKPLADAASHTVHFGSYVNETGELLDEVLATVFRSPHSYTGEDSVEISCHGSVLVTKRILENVLLNGARMAEPGEYTRRAFLNGKMDLTQAEAVADLIKTQSDQSYKASLSQLRGTTSSAIYSLRDKLLNLCSLVELELDFSEEGIELTDKVDFGNRVQTVIDDIYSFIGTYDHGRVLRDGVKVVIFGKPNVGKSSLMNALLDEERAIVTHISGTTRDTIEESIHIKGIIFRLVDTAGVRETEDIIEKEGINRTKNEIQTADVLLHLLDPISFNESEYNAEKVFLQKIAGLSVKIIPVVNKVDKLDERGKDTLISTISSHHHEISLVFISAKYKKGLGILEEKIYDVTVSERLSHTEGTVTITNLRHKELLVHTKNCLNRSLESLHSHMSGEFIAADLRAAINCLGEITGEVTTDDILNNIFSKFCIGK